MTRSELIDHLADRFPLLAAKDVEAAVKEMTEVIGRTLVQGSRVEIRGFGSFTINYWPPRMGRNPKTGEPVSVPGKWIPHFKPGKEMRELIDGSAIPALTRKVA